jgi:hypothetical protein
MLLKRVVQLPPAGWVNKRVVQQPQPRRPRLTHRVRDQRNTLVPVLLAEITRGNSMIKLYARLLAQELIADDPELARKYRHLLDAAQE